MSVADIINAPGDRLDRLIAAIEEERDKLFSSKTATLELLRLSLLTVKDLRMRVEKLEDRLKKVGHGNAW